MPWVCSDVLYSMRKYLHSSQIFPFVCDKCTRTGFERLRAILGNTGAAKMTSSAGYHEEIDVGFIAQLTRQTKQAGK